MRILFVHVDDAFFYQTNDLLNVLLFDSRVQRTFGTGEILRVSSTEAIPK